MSHFFKTSLLVAISLVVLNVCLPAEAQAQEIEFNQICLIENYCPVEAFESETRKTGNEQFQQSLAAPYWTGFYFKFYSEYNFEKFKVEPNKYIPANFGYCTVSMLDLEKSKLGLPEYFSEIDSRRYWFVSEENKNKFDESNQKGEFKYVPVLSGDCITCLQDKDERVPGTPYTRLHHSGRLFLFPNETKKQIFQNNPAKYSDFDLRLGGLCSVTYKEENGKKVEGKKEHSLMKNGFIYRFASNDAKLKFIETPNEYIQVKID
jgi:YHS domain-containing protein